MSQQKEIKMLNLLRLLAVVLVLNSHFDSLYPYPLSLLATGGAAANSLFFAISGYLLTFKNDFSKWFFRKIIRLYIPASIWTVIKYFIYGSYPGSFKDFFFDFIWPSGYWFLGAMVIFYALAYLIYRFHGFDHIKIVSATILMVYAIYYVFLLDTSFWNCEASGLTTIPALFKLIYLFFIFIIAYWMKTNKIVIHNQGFIFFAITAFILSAVIKLLFSLDILPYSIQFLTQFCNIVFALSFLVWGVGSEDRYNKFVPKGFINRIDKLSKYSFEFYIVQFLWIDIAKGLSFPVNIVFVLVMVIFSALILKAVSDLIEKFICF